MSEPRLELLQGTLDLLILQALAADALHGLGIARRIEHISGRVFDVKPGSLFPALHRLEDRQWLSSEWGVSDNQRRAKFYRLTAAGRRRLQHETAHWRALSAAIAKALEA